MRPMPDIRPPETKRRALLVALKVFLGATMGMADAYKSAASKLIREIDELLK